MELFSFIQTLNYLISTEAVQYFNTINLADTALGKFIQIFDSLLDCGHNWIMQGSIKNVGSSEKYTNYIFFMKKVQRNLSKIINEA